MISDQLLDELLTTFFGTDRRFTADEQDGMRRVLGRIMTGDDGSTMDEIDSQDQPLLGVAADVYESMFLEFYHDIVPAMIAGGLPTAKVPNMALDAAAVAMRLALTHKAQGRQIADAVAEEQRRKAAASSLGGPVARDPDVPGTPVAGGGALPVIPQPGPIY